MARSALFGLKPKQTQRGKENRMKRSRTQTQLGQLGHGDGENMKMTRSITSLADIEVLASSMMTFNLGAIKYLTK